MNVTTILEALDNEISRLRAARQLLTQLDSEPDKRGPSRPKSEPAKKRELSAEARAKIAAAQKARWAARKA